MDISKLHQNVAKTPHQANVVIAILSKIFNIAEICGARSGNSNACRHIKQYPENKYERFLSEAELGKVGEVLRTMEAEQTLAPVVM